jgi:hypothetical protein
LQRLRGQVLQREPRPLLEVRPDLPREFVALVARAMHKEPAERFASVGEMEAALGRFLGGPAPAARRSRPLAAGLGALVVVLAGLGWWAATRAPAFGLEHEFRLEHAGEERVLGEEAVIHPGDLLSLTLRLAEPVYLYLFQEDDEGRRHTLFPLPTGPQNPLPAGLLELPANNRWKLTEAGGSADHLYLLASTHPLSAAEELCKRLATPDYPGADETGPGMEETWRGLQLVLRGDWGLEQRAADGPVRSLAACFHGIENGARRSGLFFRRLILRNP